MGVPVVVPTRPESARVRPVAAQAFAGGPPKRAFRGGFLAGAVGFGAAPTVPADAPFSSADSAGSPC
ncbi:hypothetical protein BG844_23350 [Couchioplanes caeruleus subsp. caeruleus]|uniref:Uncharacterized protein n=1 Tax=Couchioplanes caeruleus subsp. caeruleus TaxID=56427 RepID=A0A1K0FGW2_9ACTN|nr:hypothetical protein BG844_23350 [Couchioplanes caeruleus subsp. caeruleus]